MNSTSRTKFLGLPLMLGSIVVAACSTQPADAPSQGAAIASSQAALKGEADEGKRGRGRGRGTLDTCAVQPGTNGSVLMTGIVLAPEGVIREGHVLYDASGVIRCVGKSCDKTPEAEAATKLDCHKAVIAAGFINGHDHVTYQDLPYAGTAEKYEHRHDWRIPNNGHTRIVTPGGHTGAQVQWAELRQLMAGTTSLNGSGHGEGLMRNLDRDGQNGGLFPAGKQALYETFPLGDSSGIELTDSCKYALTRSATDIANAAAFSPHMSEGIETSARNEFRCVSGQGKDAMDLLGPNVAFIHAIGLNAYDAAAMAVTGTSVVWSPRTNISLYGDTAQIALYKSLGVNVALGTDWLRSGSKDMLRELACADELNATYFNHALTAKDLFEMATVNGARALGAGDKVGSLAPGMYADIVVYAIRNLEGDPYRAVISAGAEDVYLTVRGGKALYGNAELVQALSGECEALDVCGVTKAVCLTGEGAGTLASLTAANNTATYTAYPLFHCGAPADEPTCTPARTNVSASFPLASQNGSTLYSGEVSDVDVDGDGLSDAADNCPSVFNPVRPMDNGAQADHDKDGVGDACDACPLSEGTEACASLEDLDRDGAANAADNCRFLANADQVDADADGKGDACDACPSDANPGLQICPPPLATIYDIKKGLVANGTVVRVKDAVVTTRIGGSSVGHFIQVDPNVPGYQGPEFSGIFLFRSPSTLKAGDRVDITGTVGAFQNQMQLTVSAAVVKSSNHPVPAPVLATPGDINDFVDGRRRELDSVLVQVQDVQVTATEPAFREFFVASFASLNISVRVDDSIFSYAMPAIGTKYRSVTGVLAYRNNQSKIEVRSAGDLVTY
jgi:cytosine/adenosine deaminase-related metal-dependent hydrolase